MPRQRLAAPAAIKWPLAASGLAFALFSLNVLWGKFAPGFGWDPGLRLSRVPEFWLLFSSAGFLVVAALAAERRASGDSLDAHIQPEVSDENRQAKH